MTEPAQSSDNDLAESLKGSESSDSAEFKFQSMDFPTPEQALAYEVHGAGWVNFLWWVPGFHAVACWYFTRRVRARYWRIGVRQEWERLSRIQNPEMWSNE